MPDWTLRTAVAADVASLEALVRDAFAPCVERIGRPPAPMTVDYERLVDGGNVLVLERTGEVIGLITLKPMDHHLLISNVAVSPAHQRRGFGALLLAEAEAAARRLGLREMRLFTNEMMYENILIYKKRGWSEYDRTDQGGFRRVFMRKIVPPVAPHERHLD